VLHFAYEWVVSNKVWERIGADMEKIQIAPVAVVLVGIVVLVLAGMAIGLTILLSRRG
jgi:hypothetical protein